MTFDYTDGWSAQPGGEGTEGHYLLMAEGRCEGRISGSLRGVNHPRRRADGTFCPDFNGAITTDEGATLLFHLSGYGRAHPADARQIVWPLTHLSEDPQLMRLNDVLCVSTGEARSDGLYVDVAELIWEPPADDPTA